MPQVICETDSEQGGTWAPDGTILFAKNLDSIYRVPASGGTPVRFTHLDPARKESRHYWPRMLPDGRHFLYVVTSPLPDVRGIWVASLADPNDKHRVLPDSSSAAYSQGYLLFARAGNLVAQRFNLRSLQVEGEATPISDGVQQSATVGWADFSVSDTGAIALGASARFRQMTWFDRTGKQLGSFREGGNLSVHETARHQEAAIALARYHNRNSEIKSWRPAMKSTGIREAKMEIPVEYDRDLRRIRYDSAKHPPSYWIRFRAGNRLHKCVRSTGSITSRQIHQRDEPAGTGTEG